MEQPRLTVVSLFPASLVLAASLLAAGLVACDPVRRTPWGTIIVFNEAATTERAACITGGRLNKEALERRLGHDAAIHDGIESHASSHTEVFAARPLVES